MLCPMCGTTAAPLTTKMICLACQREWYYIGENLASRPRAVRIVSPIVAGAKIDDCIKPLEKKS